MPSLKAFWTSLVVLLVVHTSLANAFWFWRRHDPSEVAISTASFQATPTADRHLQRRCRAKNGQTVLIAGSSPTTTSGPGSNTGSGSNPSDVSSRAPEEVTNPALASTATSISTVSSLPSNSPSSAPTTTGGKVGFPWLGSGNLSSFVTSHTK